MAQPWTTLDQVNTPEGVLELRRRGDRDFLITIAGRVLMTSAQHRSELEVARVACAELKDTRGPRVLIGGLGMGYTLREALDLLPPDAAVTVAELTPAVATWCRGPLSSLTDGAVFDSRVTVEIADVADLIRGTVSSRRWNAIVLDLYEGPHFATQGENDPLYGNQALVAIKAALEPSGVFSVWSEEPDAPFEKRLKSAGFAFERIRSGKGGRRHAVYRARDPRFGTLERAPK